MFGISWAEFLVIMLVGVLVVPAKNWPDVAKFLAGCVKFIRNLIWKISDATESIKEQIELEKPINDLIQSTTRDVMDTFSTAIKPVDRAHSGIQGKKTIRKPLTAPHKPKAVK